MIFGDPEDRRQARKLLGEFSTIGMTVAFSVFIGVWLGHWFDTGVFEGRYSPWPTMVGLMLGVIAAFKNLFGFLRKHMGEDKKND